MGMKSRNIKKSFEAVETMLPRNRPSFRFLLSVTARPARQSEKGTVFCALCENTLAALSKGLGHT